MHTTLSQPPHTQVIYSQEFERAMKALPVASRPPVGAGSAFLHAAADSWRTGIRFCCSAAALCGRRGTTCLPLPPGQVVDKVLRLAEGHRPPNYPASMATNLASPPFSSLIHVLDMTGRLSLVWQVDLQTAGDRCRWGCRGAATPVVMCRCSSMYRMRLQQLGSHSCGRCHPTGKSSRCRPSSSTVSC